MPQEVGATDGNGGGSSGVGATGQTLWASWYAASLIGLGLANIFGLLLVAAHGTTLLVIRGRAGRQVTRRWLAAVSAAVLGLLPLELLAWSQRGQVRWLRTPLAGSLANTGRLVGTAGMVLTVAVIMAAALAVTALAGWPRFGAAWPGRLAALGLPWLAVPPALLIAGSQLQPVYTYRYIVFCEPAVALLIGAGLAALGRVAGPVALALIVLAGLPAQLGERGPDGHSDNIRAMDQIIAQHARRGDAVLYPQGPGMTSFAAAYPYGLARLRQPDGRAVARPGRHDLRQQRPAQRGAQQAEPGQPGLGGRSRRAAAGPSAGAARRAVPAHPPVAGERHLAVAVPPRAAARPRLNGVRPGGRIPPGRTTAGHYQ